MRNSAIFAAAVGLLTFVLGFAFGNFLEVKYGFQLKDWQTLASTLVAIVAAGVAYVGVRTTQRLNVMMKEEDRIDEFLPGFRQVDEIFLLPRSVLTRLPRRQLYQAELLVEGAFKAQEGESLDDLFRRRLPLADNYVRREVVRMVFALKSQARILKVGYEEVERYETQVANIDSVEPSAREGLLEVTQRVKDSYDRELDTMVILIRELEKFAGSIKQRISDAEERREAIRGVIDSFFRRR